MGEGVHSLGHFAEGLLFARQNLNLCVRLVKVVPAVYRSWHGASMFITYLYGFDHTTFHSMPSGKIRFTIKEKQDIVAEAYQVENNVKKTALKFRVQPSNIRRWKSLMDLTEGLDKTRKSAEPRFENCSLYQGLLVFFEHLRARDIAVSVTMLCREARRSVTLTRGYGHFFNL